MLPCPCELDAVHYHPSVLVSVSGRHHNVSQIFSVRYADTQDEDWLIGYVPGDPSLFVATGGSGHAYKVNLARFGHIYPLTFSSTTSSCLSSAVS